ncbi:hypothetical protein Hanom_Chr14g01303691 [Helianthus anomalus]
MALNIAVKLRLLPPLLPLDPTLPTSETRPELFALLEHAGVKYKHLSPPLFANAELAFTANAAISSGWIRRLNRLTGSAKYSCPS